MELLASQQGQENRKALMAWALWSPRGHCGNKMGPKVPKLEGEESHFLSRGWRQGHQVSDFEDIL